MSDSKKPSPEAIAYREEMTEAIERAESIETMADLEAEMSRMDPDVLDQPMSLYVPPL